jgi:hypothetical protein
MMTDKTSLRSQLVSAWELVEYTATKPGSSEKVPMGPDAKGIVVYTADEYVSAHLRDVSGVHN